jgi:hypothetical protein
MILTFHGHQVAATNVIPPSSSMPPKVTCVGYLFDGDTPCTGEKLAQQVAKAVSNPDARRNLNGSFSGVVVDGEAVALLTDRYGTRPLYYAIEGPCLLAGWDFWKIVQGLSTASLNLPAAVELLSFSYVLGAHTLVERVFEVPGATCMKFRFDQRGQTWELSTTETYWRYDLHPQVRPAGQIAGYLAQVFGQIANRWGRLIRESGTSSVGLNLSAGHDSRLVLAMLCHQGIRPVCFTSHSIGEENDSAFALSRYLGLPHVFLPFWKMMADKPPEEIFWGLAPTTTPTIANHSIALAVFGGGADMVVSGHLGDVLAGSHLLPQGLNAARKGKVAVAQWLLHHHLRLNMADLKSLLRKEHHDLVSQPADAVTTIVGAAQSNDLRAVLVQFDLEQRQRRMILRDYMATLTCWKQSSLPLADTVLADSLAGLPMNWLVGMCGYVSGLSRFLYSVDPQLLRVPINGRRIREISLPSFWRYREFGRKAIRKLFHATSYGGYDPKEVNEIERWVTNLDALLEPNLVVEIAKARCRSPLFMRSNFRALYTLSHVISRLRNECRAVELA